MILRRIARIKARAVRLNLYIQVWQLLALLAILGWRWWYIPVAAVFGVLYLYESKYGIQGEMAISWQASEAWQSYLKEFEEVKKTIQGGNEKDTA